MVARPSAIEAVRMQVNGSPTAVLGVDPSAFRSFAARPTGAANAALAGRRGRRHRRLLHDGQAGQDPARRHGHRGRAAARRSCRWWRSARLASAASTRWCPTPPPARSAPRPGNAIVVSVRAVRLHRRVGRHRAAAAQGGRRRAARLAGQLGRVAPGPAAPARPVRPADRSAVPSRRSDTMLKAAMSRRGMPVRVGRGRAEARSTAPAWCSGRSRQAGIVMPRVAADQALYRPRRACEPA